MNKEELTNIIRQKKSAPFLFLGSGFTKHYLDTPVWETLLSKFAPNHINAYYTLSGTRELPVIASEIAKDVTKSFWNLPETDSERRMLQDKVKTQSSVLKYRIANYLKTFKFDSISEELKEEIELLQSINIDGIITTNWDDLIECIFPKFTSYVGQEELIFSSILNIGEIYKILWC
mgnify:FL=1